jgi:hypothetical protein
LIRQDPTNGIPLGWEDFVQLAIKLIDDTNTGALGVAATLIIGLVLITSHRGATGSG